MYIREVINAAKPLTPAQSRVHALQRNVDNARQALKRERTGQQVRNTALRRAVDAAQQTLKRERAAQKLSAARKAVADASKPKR
jgi:outer membrane protein TolC